MELIKTILVYLLILGALYVGLATDLLSNQYSSPSGTLPPTTQEHL